MSKSKKFFIIFIAGVLLVVLFGFLFQDSLSKNKTSLVSTPPQKIYKSDVLDFRINVPSSYSVIEDFNVATILNNDKSEITIDKIGTNFINVEEYVSNLEKLNDIKFINKDKANIDNYDSIVAFSEDGKEKIYFIYADNRIYTFSTSDLYDDLDAIVRSFEYIPKNK